MALCLAPQLDAVGHSVAIFNDGDAVRPSGSLTAPSTGLVSNADSAQESTTDSIWMRAVAREQASVLAVQHAGERERHLTVFSAWMAHRHFHSTLLNITFIGRVQSLESKPPFSQYRTLPNVTVIERVQSLESKPPFSQYSTLPNVNVIYGDPKDPSTYPQWGFDIIYDNNGKSLEECQPLIDKYAGSVRFPLSLSFDRMITAARASRDEC